MIAHTLNDKIVGIISRCGLLSEKTEPGTEFAKQLTAIHKIAESALTELKDHQRRAESEKRKAG